MWMPVHLSDHYYDPERDYCGLYIVAKIELPEFGPTTELLKILVLCSCRLELCCKHSIKWFHCGYMLF